MPPDPQQSQAAKDAGFIPTNTESVSPIHSGVYAGGYNDTASPNDGVIFNVLNGSSTKIFPNLPVGGVTSLRGDFGVISWYHFLPNANSQIIYRYDTGWDIYADVPSPNYATVACAVPGGFMWGGISSYGSGGIAIVCENGTITNLHAPTKSYAFDDDIFFEPVTKSIYALVTDSNSGSTLKDQYVYRRQNGKTTWDSLGASFIGATRLLGPQKLLQIIFGDI